MPNDPQTNKPVSADDLKTVTGNAVDLLKNMHESSPTGQSFPDFKGETGNKQAIAILRRYVNSMNQQAKMLKGRVRVIGGEMPTLAMTENSNGTVTITSTTSGRHIYQFASFTPVVPFLMPSRIAIGREGAPSTGRFQHGRDDVGRLYFADTTQADVFRQYMKAIGIKGTFPIMHNTNLDTHGKTFDDAVFLQLGASDLAAVSQSLGGRYKVEFDALTEKSLSPAPMPTENPLTQQKLSLPEQALLTDDGSLTKQEKLSLAAQSMGFYKKPVVKEPEAPKAPEVPVAPRGPGGRGA